MGNETETDANVDHALLLLLPLSGSVCVIDWVIGNYHSSGISTSFNPTYNYMPNTCITVIYMVMFSPLKLPCDVQPT